MPKYIERESAIKFLLNDCLGQVNYSREDAADCIFWLDAADVAPVRHGRWIDCEEDPNEKYCSVCNHERNACNSWWNYCPNCGCKMDLED